MKAFFDNIQTIIIAVLIGIILLQRACTPSNIQEPTIIETVKKEVIYDTITKEIVKYVPKYKTKIVTDTVFKNVDTSEILKDYYTKYVYSDTIKIDTIGEVVVRDTITQNSIVYRNPYINIKIPTTTITKTNTIIENNRELYLGPLIGINSDQFNYIGANAIYRTKKKQAYSLGFGVNQDMTPTYSLGIYWRLQSPLKK